MVKKKLIIVTTTIIILIGLKVTIRVRKKVQYWVCGKYNHVAKKCNNQLGRVSKTLES